MALLATVAVLPLLLSPGSAVAQAVTRTTDLSFSTRGQSLFADIGNVTKTEEMTFDVINEKQTNLKKGRIENSRVPLSVATLQTIWQRAVDTCTSQSYTVPVVGTTIHPSQTECINGEIRRNYCVAPPHLGWSSCPDIFGNRKTFVKDVGPGIGPKPTQPTKKPYDFGAIVTMTSEMRVGFEGFYTYDLGSVDVDYSAQARLDIDRSTADPGDLVTITTSLTDRDPYVMTSRYPYMELGLDMFAYAKMSIDAQYAGVDEKTGNQVRTTKNLHSIDSRENPDAIDGIMPFTNGKERLFGVRLDTSGLTTWILGDETQVPALYEYNLTYPFGSPDKPGKKAPKFRTPVSFSLMDFAFMPPKLDTPAPFGFECGDCVPLRNFVDNGTLINTTPVGNRQLIGGITDGNGIVLPFVNDGHQDVDLARFDIDLDVITVAAGVPLGAVVSDPIGVLEVEANLLDLDFATFLSADQTLRFVPNLEVDLRFSVPTEVRLASATDFEVRDSIRIPVGESVVFRQPSTAVTITPVYSVSNNAFSNETQLKISNAIQESLGQIKLGGYVGDHLEEVQGESPNFALLQLTPTLYEPRSIWSTDTTPWSLGGFIDRPDTPVTVSLSGSGGVGPGSGNGNGNGNGSGGGSGGGAFDWTVAVLLLCLVLIRALRAADVVGKLWKSSPDEDGSRSNDASTEGVPRP